MWCIMNELMNAGLQSFMFVGNEFRRLRGTVADMLLMEMLDNNDI